jgi:uncharacterized protein (DUF58 family)
MSENSNSQLTPLMSNSVLSRIERMRINSLCRFTNRQRGEHLSGRGGASMEFSDYRDYSPGDDLRFIDWNIFARLQRPYLKLFKVEEEMHLVIIIDASNSMMFDGKLELAKSLAAAYGVMGLYGNERVSVYVMNDASAALPSHLPAAAGRGNMKKLFHFLENIESGGTTAFDKGIDKVLTHHRGKGVALLLSDFLTFGNIKRAMNSLFSASLEICAVQILSPAEINPDLHDDSRFIDSETEMHLDVTSGGDLLSIYHEHKNNFIKELSETIRKRSGRFVSVSSDITLSDIVFDNLLRHGWIK